MSKNQPRGFVKTTALAPLAVTPFPSANKRPGKIVSTSS